MVLPVASGRLLARSFKTTVAVAVLVGAFSVVAGLVAARVWALAAGPESWLAEDGLDAYRTVWRRAQRAFRES
jgi:ABC-type Mn2+/Zn2+ transport system permease subunit